MVPGSPLEEQKKEVHAVVYDVMALSPIISEELWILTLTG